VTFLSIVGHDLRNPLNVAIGRMELAREECANEYLANTATDLKRSRNLIEWLLTLAREGRWSESLEAMSPTTVTEGCWKTVATVEAAFIAKEQGAIPVELKRLNGFSKNLFRNVVEHGGEDVTVYVGSIPGEFCVTDTGSGIPPSKCEAVFKPSYLTMADGIDFELATVREIVGNPRLIGRRH